MNDGKLTEVSSSPCPAEPEGLRSLEGAAKRDWVYVAPLDWWLGEKFGYWESDTGVGNDKEWNIYVASGAVCNAPPI
jgi:hypothetical protein